MNEDPFFDWYFLMADVMKWGLLGWFGAQFFFSMIPKEHGPEAVLASVVTGLIAIPLSCWLYPEN